MWEFIRSNAVPHSAVEYSMVCYQTRSPSSLHLHNHNHSLERSIASSRSISRRAMFTDIVLRSADLSHQGSEKRCLGQIVLSERIIGTSFSCITVARTIRESKFESFTRFDVGIVIGLR